MVMRVRSDGLRDDAADGQGRSPSHEKVALRVIQLRMRAGISQEELARRVGTTKSAISRLESGRHTPNVETLQRIAEAVGARLVITFE
jgi:transcriptional regulator with XRE-family HTH domain